MQILNDMLTLTNAVTNTLYAATNGSSFTATNTAGGGGATNLLGVTNVNIVVQNLINFSTNHVFTINPVICATNYLSAFQGMDKIRFVRGISTAAIGRPSPIPGPTGSSPTIPFPHRSSAAW